MKKRSIVGLIVLGLLAVVGYILRIPKVEPIGGEPARSQPKQLTTASVPSDRGTVQAVIKPSDPVLVQMLTSDFHTPYCSPNEQWKVPEYRELRIGESSKSDAEKVLGPGKASECDSPERKAALLEYADPRGFRGRLTIFLNCETNIIEYLTLEPSEPLSLGSALGIYGPGYCYRRFDMLASEDPDDFETGRLVENPQGTSWVQVEYPSKGVVLAPDSFHRIRLIIYKRVRD